jgi:DNA-binding CsgD family transcriptional regulator
VSGARNGVGPQRQMLKRRPTVTREPRSSGDGLAVRRRNGVQRTTDLSVLGSHPVLASLLAARLQQQANTVAETLGVIGLPAAVLASCGKVLAANKLFAALTPALIWEMSGRPRLTDPVADRLIGDALTRLASSSPAGFTRAIPIRTAKGKPAAIAYLIGAQGAGNEPLADICGVLIVVPIRARSAPSPQMVQRLFGLSPAEARVACGIAGRQTIEAIAGDFGVSRETVRCQLKTVLAKTGAKRQLDLAVLLCSIQLAKF